MGANVEWEARRDYADFMEAALASGFFLAIVVVILWAIRRNGAQNFPSFINVRIIFSIS